MLPFVLLSLAFLNGYLYLSGTWGILCFLSWIPYIWILERPLSSRENVFLASLWAFLVHLVYFFWISEVSFIGWIILSFYHGIHFFILAKGWKYFASWWERALLLSTLEWFREVLFWGSPLGRVSEILADIPVFTQLSSVGGCMMVSFWIFLINGFIYEISFKKNWRRVPWLLIVFLLPLCWGHYRIHKKVIKRLEEVPLKVQLVQPFFKPLIKWDARKDQECFNQLLQISKVNEDFKGLIVWPETALTSDVRKQTIRFAKLKELGRSLQSSLLIGMPSEHSQKESFNSLFLLEPGRNTFSQEYRKNKLVPMGEFVPWEKSLPFLKTITPIESSFTPGISTIEMKVQDWAFLPLVCFEDCFSTYVRNGIGERTDFIITSINNGWFTQGSWGINILDRAARLRAVENGIPLLRCGNTGVTSKVNAFGQREMILPRFDRAGREVQGALVCHVFEGDRQKTLFSSWGYAWLVAAWLLALVRSFFFLGDFKMRSRPS